MLQLILLTAHVPSVAFFCLGLDLSYPTLIFFHYFPHSVYVALCDHVPTWEGSTIQSQGMNITTEHKLGVHLMASTII